MNYQNIKTRLIKYIEHSYVKWTYVGVYINIYLKTVKIKYIENQTYKKKKKKLQEKQVWFENNDEKIKN